MPGEVRQALGRRISRKDTARADELEAIVERSGHLVPRDFWPGMQLLAIWTGGSVGAYLPALRDDYGQIPIRDHGLSASEGRMTIPVADGTAAGILDVTTHFFEFIPESEYGRPDPNVLEAHELEEGKNYYILLTTSSGLTRYNICDVVRCTGFYHSTPLVEFLHKGAHIANLTGEKISESQVVAAVRGATDEMRLCLSHFTVSPVWGNPPKYHLHIEQADIPGAAPRRFAGLAGRQPSQVDQLRVPRQTGLGPPRTDRVCPPAGRNVVRLRPAPPPEVGGQPRTVQAPLPGSRPGIQLETPDGSGGAACGRRRR